MALNCRVLLIIDRTNRISISRSSMISTATSYLFPCKHQRMSIQRSILFYCSDHSLITSRRFISTSPYRSRDHPAPAFAPFHPAVHVRLENEQDAEEFLHYLHKPEREILYKVLRSHHKKAAAAGEGAIDDFDSDLSPITRDQVRLLFLCNSLPFIGFGFLDNLIMILAGEYIDSTIGIVFGLSTMAAAGFGNIISDIAGVGLAHYVEFFVAKFFNVRPPPLTADQWDSSKVRWTTNLARAVGLTIGCLIGMFPLFFFNESEKQERKLQAKHHQEEESKSTND